jgi:3-methyladenine DNA glycosylase AlkD
MSGSEHIINTQEARLLGKQASGLIAAGQTILALDLLTTVLAERTPFAKLRRIGEPIGAGPVREVDAFLDLVAEGRTEGGWVIIASGLKAQLGRDLPGAFVRCRRHIIAADVWYGCDILGEGVVGEALVAHFEPALEQLSPWREDANPWIRRAVGVAVHFWAKRSRGASGQLSRAEALLSLLEPMFWEWDMTVVKGVGWGFKTLGRYYPRMVADWLVQTVVADERRHRALMLHKALSYLPDEQRARVVGQDVSGLS